MDLDDLDAPNHAPSRVSRFAPKSSKLKPKPSSEAAGSLAEPPKREDSGIHVAKTEPPEAKAAKSEVAADHGFVKKMEAETASASASMADVSEEAEEETAPMEVDEGEDTVVREIDVFLNPKIDDDTQLYVFQYPMRPSWRPYELESRCEEVRVKPGSDEVEIDLSMDTDSKNYDQECHSSKKMEIQTLGSEWKVPPATGYALGLLKGNKLHLNPIHAVVQLRSMHGSKRKSNASGEEDSKGKKLAPSLKQNKPGSSSMEQKIADDNLWVPLKYQGSETELSSTYFKRMVAQESTPLQFTMNPNEYLRSLCPASSNDDVQAKGPSKKLLLSLPLEERIKKIFCEGPAVHRFNALKHIAPDYSDEQILDVLQLHGVLVQGLWAPKSSLLYDSKQGAQRITRDYVLLLFWENPVISFSALRSFPTSLKTVANEFLNIFAVERSSVNNWKFKEQMDTSFVKAHPDIVRKQGLIWEELGKDIRGQFAAKSARGAKNPTLPNRIPKPLQPSKTVPKVSNEVIAGKNIPDDIREVLSSKVLPKVIQDHKVCSFQLICQGLRDLALNKLNLPKADPRFVKAVEYGTDSPEELKKLAEQIAINIHGLYVLKSSLDHPQFDPFRNVVIDLLRKNGPNAKLKKAEIYDAAKNVLKRDVTTSEYSKVMSEICMFKGSFWMLKSGDGNPT